MHSIISLAALSWIIVLSIAAIAQNALAIAFGALPYSEASPTIAVATLCLAVAIETFVRNSRSR